MQLFSMCAVFGEPLSQTAQSFMPELMYGVNRSLPKVSCLFFILQVWLLLPPSRPMRMRL